MDTSQFKLGTSVIASDIGVVKLDGISEIGNIFKQ
jgi:hypothetical protein